MSACRLSLISHVKKHRSEPAYLKYVRQTPCLACESPYPSAHHIQRVGEKGMGLKSSDKWAVPLCHRCHMDLHQGGVDEMMWWALKGVDAIKWAERSYKDWKTRKA